MSSYCDDHAWTRSKYKPGKKSIFSLSKEKKGEEEEEEEEAADASDADEEVEPTDAEEEERRSRMEDEKKKEGEGSDGVNEQGRMREVHVEGTDELEEMRNVTEDEKRKEDGDGDGVNEQGRISKVQVEDGSMEESGDGKVCEAVEVGDGMLKLSLEGAGSNGGCYGNQDEAEDDLTSLDEEIPAEFVDANYWDNCDDADAFYDAQEEFVDTNCFPCGEENDANLGIDAGISREMLAENVAEKSMRESQEPAHADVYINPNVNNNNSNFSFDISCDWGCYDNNPNNADGDDGKSESTSCAPSGTGGAMSKGNERTGAKKEGGSKEKKDGNGNGKRGSRNGGGGRDRKSPGDASGRKSVMQLDTGPTFYIGGNNGVAL